MSLLEIIQKHLPRRSEADILASELPFSTEALRAIDDYLDEAPVDGWWRIKPRDFPSGAAILNAEPQFQIAVLLAALPIAQTARRRIYHYVAQQLYTLIQDLMRRALPFTDVDLIQLIQLASDSSDSVPQGVVKILDTRVRAGAPLAPSVQKALRAWRTALDAYEIQDAKLQIKMEELLSDGSLAPLLGEEPWGANVLTDLAAMAPSEGKCWHALLSYAMQSDATKPAAKWLKQAKPLIDAVGQKAFLTRASQWTKLFAAHHLPDVLIEGAYEQYLEGIRLTTILNHNYSALKGMAWCCRLLDDAPAAAAFLGDLAEVALRKIPGHGPKSAKIGNASILTLGAMSGLEPVAQLSRLKRKVKYVASQGMIETALAEAAKRAGLPAEDLEELATPTFGLDAGGRREEMGDYFADLVITPGGHAELIWSDRHGKTLKSVPAEVKKNHPETLQELKQTFSEMTKMLPALRDRMEGLLLTERAWPVADWRERYLDHPVMGTLARRLIWSFTDGERSVLGIWRDGELVDETGRPLPAMSESATVRLWHPLGADPQTVLAWRQSLETHEVRQPFKQAHREIYLLTDAEIATETYSNRFAAHIIRQHQFQALCRERGWRYQLQGGFDGHNTPTLNLPKHGLRAEFWVAGGDGYAMSASYIDLYVSTDQVRFYNDRGALLPLTGVPPLLFSEIMRDVDLFVGVCSIGNDPNWQHNDGVRTYDAYWTDYSFGDLTATAQTRHDVLSRLLPRLKIASQCTLDGKFLHVRGSLRTYKIHLGSGNILMEPNDQYLCIVPDRKKDAKADASQIFLPFEGDQTLAVILSKAFLLAEDGKIKDPTILRQIQR